ncbi:hypothetical protein ES704_00625 [subsurface metagenome]|jgi:hypothetical protein
MYYNFPVFIHFNYNLKKLMCQRTTLYCHLKDKTGLFFNDLKDKSGLTWNGKKDVI